jgi:exodeoxyribonuclease-3
MKIISYNVNGIRAALNKDWIKWLTATNPDVVCLQEIKANPEQFDTQIFEEAGYKHFWYPAQKKGYSGTAILCKTMPDNITYGCGIEAYDFEGRVIRADFGDKSVVSAYFPSGSSGDERQVFKMQFLHDMYAYFNELKESRKKLVVAGDYNICHQAIDIHDPVRNATVSGFLPEEREWMSNFLASGFTDSFRLLNKEPHNYTWWSYRASARPKNLGWRIDYHMVSEAWKSGIKRAAILADAIHSDHCPILLEIE